MLLLGMARFAFEPSSRAGHTRQMFFFCHTACALVYGSNGPCEKYLSDFSFALQCPFWVWLLSLSVRFAVDSDTCSSALLYAHPAMPRVLFKGKDKATSPAGFCFKAKECVRFFPPLTLRGGWEGLVVIGVSFAASGCAFKVWLASLSC